MLHTVTYEEYAAWKRLRASDLKFFLQSSDLFSRHMAGELPAKKSHSLDIGTHLHCKILEPKRFINEYVVYHGGRRCGNKYNEFKQQHNGKTFIIPSELERIEEMSISLHEHEIIGPILRQPLLTEQSIQFNCHNIPCKARIDAFYEDTVFDLKTTYSLTSFLENVEKLGYMLAMGFYCFGLEQVLSDYKVMRFGFLVVESTPPFASKVFWVNRQDILKEIKHVDHILCQLKPHLDLLTLES